jgi:predicted lysophospholipase L1 biosynthesis ABC-type transport system permease subunit
VVLIYNKPFAKIEFSKINKPSKDYARSSGHFQNANHISDVTKEILPKSGLLELSNDFEKMEKRLNKKVDRFYTQFLTIITIVIAILGVLAGKLLLGF